MLSDYKEIINNWELAINSQGFTNEQVAEQLDTVARKWQSFKDNITGIIANGGNGGISEFIKNFLELGNGLLTWLNNLDSTTWKVISTTLEFAGALWGIHKIWKYLSNVIQTYRMSLNEAMASTVASEGAVGVAAATSASEVNSLAMAEGRAGSVAIYSADGQRILSTAERQAGRNAIMATGGMTGLAIAEGAVGVAGEGGAIGLSRLNVEMRKLDISAKTLLIESVVGIAVVALTELTASYLEATSAAQQFGNQKVLELEQQSAAIEIYKEQDEFVHALTGSYVALIQAQKDETLTAEKQANLSKDIEETEEKLSAQLDQGAIERIKNSQDVAAAAEEEYQVYHQTTEQKITAAENEKQAIGEYTKQLKANTATMIEEYRRDRQKFVENIDKKIDALSAFESATIALGKVQLWWSRINEDAYQHEYDNLNDKVWNLEQKEERTPYEERQLEEAKARMSVLNDKINNEEQYQKDKMAEMMDAHFKDQINKIKNNIETLKQLDGNGGVRTSPGGGNIVRPSEDKPKKSNSFDRGGYNNRYAQTDPVVNAINNAVKNIQSKLNDQLKELQRIQKKQGANKENTLAQDKAYERAINATKAQIEKARGHFEAGNSKLFNGEIMQSMRDNLTNEILSEAQTWLDTPYVMGGTTKSGVDCSAFVQNVLGQVGINLQRTADYQAQQYIDSGNFDTDLASAKVGDLVFFKDTYDAGPGVNSATHVGIVTGIDSNGNVQMINASSSNGVSYANVNSGFWGDHFYGVGHNGGMTGASIPFSEKLAEFLTTTINGVVHRVTQEEWDSVGYEGQLSYIRAAKGDEANKSEERQALLSAAENELLGSAKAFKDATDALNNMIEQAADTYIKNINAEVSSATRKVERKNNRRLAELGSGATETDKARAEVEKATAALAVYKDAMSRDASEKYKETEQFKDFIDDFYKRQSDALAKQVALIEAQYNDAIKVIGHNAKMRDYGVDNTEDAWGQKRATDAYADLLTKRKALQKELEDLDKTDPKYIDKHNSIQEELVAVNKEIRDASTQHIRTIREGYSGLVKELIFDGKDFGEMLSQLWVDLGKNAWDLLLTGKMENPSFLAQLLGFGDVNKDAAEAQSNAQWAQIQQTTGSIDTKLITTNNYLAQILSFISTGSTFGYGKYDMSKSFSENLGLTKTYDTNVPFSQALGLTKKYDTNVPITKAFDSSTKAMLSMKKSSDLNTQKIVDNTNTMSNNTNTLSNVGGVFGNFVGSLTGNSKLGGIIGSGLSLAGSLLGRTKGSSIPKLATGGAPAGRIKGAGSGRSDSILAYLQDKDKFVWLSNGEYVINEKSAKALGYDTLDKLNGYATGGPLDTSITNPTPYVPTINPQVAQRTTTIYGSNKMTEYLLREQNKKMAQQNEMLKNMNTEGGNGKMIVLNTQASSADVLRALQENPRAVQAIMGQQRNMGFR